MKSGPCSEEAVFLKWCWLGDDRAVNDVLEGTPTPVVIRKTGVGRALCCDSMASPEGFGHCSDRQTSIGGGGGILNSVLDRIADFVLESAWGFRNSKLMERVRFELIEQRWSESPRDGERILDRPDSESL